MKKASLFCLIIISTFLFACSENLYYSNSSSTNLIEGSIFTAPVQFANVKIYKILDGTEHYLGTAKCDKLGKFSFPTSEFGPFIAKYESGSGNILGSNNPFFFENLNMYIQDNDSYVNTFAFLATSSLQDNPSALDFFSAYEKIIKSAVLCAIKAGYLGIDSASLKSSVWSPQAEVALSCLAVAAGAQYEDEIHNLAWFANFNQIINEYSPETIVGMTDFNQNQLDLINKSVKNVLNNVNNQENTEYTIEELKNPNQNVESNEITGLYFFTEDPKFLAQGYYEAKSNINTINVISNSDDKRQGELNIWVMGLSSTNEVNIFKQDNLEQHYADLEKQVQDGKFVYAYNTEAMLDKLQNAFYPRFSHFIPAYNIHVEVSPNADITITRDSFIKNGFKINLKLKSNTNQSYKITVTADFGKLGTVRNYLEVNARDSFGSDIDYAKNGWNIQFQKEVTFSLDKVQKELSIRGLTGSPKSWILNARNEANDLIELAKGTTTSPKISIKDLAKGKYRLFFSSYGSAIYNGETVEKYGANRPRGYYELTID